MATKITVLTIASADIPPSRAWLLDSGRVVVEQIGRMEFADLDAARARFPATEFTVTTEQVDSP